MRTSNLLVVVGLGALAACTSGPTKNQSLKVFAAATAEMASAQSSAVADARTHASAAPGQLTLQYSGPCSTGGTVAVTGSYDGSGTGDQSTFDLAATFASCATAEGTLDGNLAWHSQASSTGFAETMTGSLSYAGGGDSLSCDFNLSLSVDASGVTYGGTVCGYDVQADLHVPPHP